MGRVWATRLLNQFVEVKVAKVSIYMGSAEWLDWLVSELEGKRFEDQGQKTWGRASRWT